MNTLSIADMPMPFCMQAMLNKKLVSLSELSDHTITDQVRKPEYLT